MMLLPKGSVISSSGRICPLFSATFAATRFIMTQITEKYNKKKVLKRTNKGYKNI